MSKTSGHVDVAPTSLLLVLSAPTGGGKTTIARRLVEGDGSLRFSVSHTTREPRPGERDGCDYHFVSEVIFSEMAARGEFLEWAQVHEHRYGTHRSEREAAFKEGRGLLLDIDVQGGLQVKRAAQDAILVFILPPNLDVMLKRLAGRAKEKGFNLSTRLLSALKELDFARTYDYNIVNEDLDGAVSQVRSILSAARTRPSGVGSRVGRLSLEIQDWLRSHDVQCPR